MSNIIVNENNEITTLVIEERYGEDGAKGDKGDPGSDANVTEANITTALGYTPANKDNISVTTSLKSDFYTETTVHYNSQPPINGVFPQDTLRDSTDFIPVEGLEEITIRRSDGGEIIPAIVFYTDKNTNVQTVGSWSSPAPSFTATIPEGTKYAVTVVRRMASGTDSLGYFGDTFIAEGYIKDGVHLMGDIYKPSEDINLENKLYEKVKNSLGISDLSGKNLAIFTSSNGDPYWGTWPIDVADSLGMNLNNNGAAPGGTYYLLDENHNSLVKKIESHLNSSEPSPDLILFNSGMNEAGDMPNVDIGDFDTVINQDIATIRSTFNTTFGINTLYGSMKWCFETLISNYPNAHIIVFTPFQCYHSISEKFIPLHEPITKMAKWYSCPVIDCFYEGGIVSAFETQGALGRHTVDGVHIKKDNVINEDGRVLQKNFLIKKINQNYHSR